MLRRRLRRETSILSQSFNSKYYFIPVISIIFVVFSGCLLLLSSLSSLFIFHCCCLFAFRCLFCFWYGDLYSGKHVWLKKQKQKTRQMYAPKADRTRVFKANILTKRRYLPFVSIFALFFIACSFSPSVVRIFLSRMCDLK